jgi:hypothetical protein
MRYAMFIARLLMTKGFTNDTLLEVLKAFYENNVSLANTLLDYAFQDDKCKRKDTSFDKDKMTIVWHYKD